MKKITIEIEPATLECIEKTFKAQIHELENRLTRWRLKEPDNEYEQDLKKQILEETLKEISDLKLHYSSIVRAYHHEYDFA